MFGLFAGGGTFMALREGEGMLSELAGLCGLGVSAAFAAAAFLLFRE